MSREAYFAKMRPYAERAANALSIPVEVILAQWAHESAYGTSSLAQRANNHGGIKWSKYNQVGATKTGSLNYAAYNSLSDYVTDYVRVMSLSYYSKVRGQKTVEGAVKALDESPYAEDPKYGSKLLAILGKSEIPSGSATDNKELLLKIGAAAIGLVALINEFTQGGN
jgi:flagellar protein FlgJ